MAKEILKKKEVAERTGLSEWAIDELRRRGKIPFIKLPGMRVYLYDIEAVERWLERLQAQSINLSESGGHARAKK